MATEGNVRVEFEVEGKESIVFKQLAAYAAPDVAYKEYENGVVIANPSEIAEYTFNLFLVFWSMKYIASVLFYCSFMPQVW